MAQEQVTVTVESEIQDLMNQIVSVVKAIKEGKGISTVALEELFKLQKLIVDLKAVPTDFQESFSASLKPIASAVIDIATVLLGKN